MKFFNDLMKDVFCDRLGHKDEEEYWPFPITKCTRCKREILRWKETVAYSNIREVKQILRALEKLDNTTKKIELNDFYKRAFYFKRSYLIDMLWRFSDGVIEMAIQENLMESKHEHTMGIPKPRTLIYRHCERDDNSIPVTLDEFEWHHWKCSGEGMEGDCACLCHKQKSFE